MRGENGLDTPLARLLRGTSPRARGKLTNTLPKAKKLGNIPACAGKTSDAINAMLREKEHPRVRGENKMRCDHLIDAQGTSPRARGKRL